PPRSQWAVRYPDPECREPPVGAGGRAGREHRPPPQHRVVADAAAVAEDGALVDGDGGADQDARADLGPVAEHEPGGVARRPHHRAAAPREMVSPPRSSEVCIASSTSTTRTPHSTSP